MIDRDVLFAVAFLHFQNARTIEIPVRTAASGDAFPKPRRASGCMKPPLWIPDRPVGERLELF